jgi:ribosome-binding factor A
MRTYERSDRVAGLIKQVMAELLQKQISDPRLARTTITGVTVSKDLRNAKVYFATAEGEKAHQAANEGFEHARGFLKRELAQRLGLRYMPELQFLHDASIDYGARIERLLKAVKDNDKKHS